MAHPSGYGRGGNHPKALRGPEGKERPRDRAVQVQDLRGVVVMPRRRVRGGLFRVALSGRCWVHLRRRRRLRVVSVCAAQKLRAPQPGGGERRDH
ncbi:MAG: hypothetical protein QOI30_2724, partial [Mycobacterium sp.]|nr:hypothetical protein [Mycobacterium sp.]